MFSTLYRNINLLILLFIFSSTCFGCQTKDTLYYTNPDKKVAEMIFNKQIVMIGEAPHSHPIGFDGVIKILNEWLKQLQEDASKPQNLTLILETDSSYAFDIDKYFDNGIIDSILDPRIPIENYEFYNNLRYFHEKIDSINKANNSAVSFTVRGFEEVGENLMKPIY